MFRFYSLCAPSGKPEPAVLAAAQEVPHRWDFDGVWSLSIQGLRSSELVFFYGEDALCLSEPGLVVKTTKPPKGAEFFFVEPWISPQTRLGSQMVKVPASQPLDFWVRGTGQIVNLSDIDAKVFGVRGKTRKLPVVYFGQKEKEKTTAILVPAKFLPFLMSTEGPLSGKALVAPNKHKITVILKTKKNKFVEEIVVDKEIDLKDSDQKFFLSGDGDQLYLPLVEGAPDGLLPDASD